MKLISLSYRRVSVRVCACPSVTSRYCTETATARRIELGPDLQNVL